MNIYSIRQHIEQFHLLFLDQLSKKCDPKFYALKGGCNLRFFFNSIRYSEDIDLDVHIIQKETLKKKVQGIFQSLPFQNILRTKGIEITNISTSKQTETTQRWKLLLKVGDTTMPLPTRMEFSRRGLQDLAVFETVSTSILQLYQLMPIMINHYSATTALKQKICALADRNQTQARDIFDIYLLLTTQNIEITFTDLFKPVIDEALKKSLTVTFQDFIGQVVSYLLPEYQARYNTEQIWRNIVETVITFLKEKRHAID